MPEYFAGGYVRQDVREIQIRRNEDTLFAATHINDALIRLAAKCLLDYRVSIVPGRRKQG